MKLHKRAENAGTDRGHRPRDGQTPQIRHSPVLEEATLCASVAAKRECVDGGGEARVYELGYVLDDGVHPSVAEARQHGERL